MQDVGAVGGGNSKPLPTSKLPLSFRFKPTTDVTTFWPTVPPQYWSRFSISASGKRHRIDPSRYLVDVLRRPPPPRPTSLRSSCPTSDSKVTRERPVSKPHSWTLRFAGATIVLCGRKVTLGLAHAIGSQGKILGCGHVGEKARRDSKPAASGAITAQVAALAKAHWPAGRRHDLQGRAAGTGAERV